MNTTIAPPMNLPACETEYGTSWVQTCIGLVLVRKTTHASAPGTTAYDVIRKGNVRGVVYRTAHGKWRAESGLGGENATCDTRRKAVEHLLFSRADAPRLQPPLSPLPGAPAAKVVVKGPAISTSPTKAQDILRCLITSPRLQSMTVAAAIRELADHDMDAFNALGLVCERPAPSPALQGGHSMKPFFPALMALLLVAPAYASGTFTGRVVAIADGDTVTVLVNGHEQKRIRLLGIDAPETAHGKDGAQPFGQKSKDNLALCAFGKNVTVEWTEQDRYGRTLGKIVANGADCNLRQVADGYAWHYKQYARSQPGDDASVYAKAETDARAAQKGLWRDAHPVPPWDYRHGESSSGKGAGAKGINAVKTSGAAQDLQPGSQGKGAGYSGYPAGGFSWSRLPWFVQAPLLIAAGLLLAAFFGWMVERMWRTALYRSKAQWYLHKEARREAKRRQTNSTHAASSDHSPEIMTP